MLLLVLLLLPYTKPSLLHFSSCFKSSTLSLFFPPIFLFSFFFLEITLLDSILFLVQICVPFSRDNSLNCIKFFLFLVPICLPSFIFVCLIMHFSLVISPSLSHYFFLFASLIHRIAFVSILFFLYLVESREKPYLADGKPRYT